MLFGAAALLGGSLRNLDHQSFGFNPDGRFLVFINPLLSNYKQEQLVPLFCQIQDRVAAIPGVRSVSAATYAPLSGDQWGHEVHFGCPILTVSFAVRVGGDHPHHPPVFSSEADAKRSCSREIRGCLSHRPNPHHTPCPGRAVCVRPLYSTRNAAIGSTRVARLAGPHTERNATMASNSKVTTKATGSSGFTPNRKLAR